MVVGHILERKPEYLNININHICKSLTPKQMNILQYYTHKNIYLAG